MSRAVGIKGRGTEMCSVLVGRAEGIILQKKTEMDSECWPELNNHIKYLSTCIKLTPDYMGAYYCIILIST